MEAITLQKFIEDNPQKKIKADIQERWVTRIEPRKLQEQGEAGAQVYLRDYGKSIAAPKCLQFGALAIANGYPEFAAGFYKKAAELMGVQIYPEVSDAGNHSMTPIEIRRRAEDTSMDPPLPDFPANMQPGKFVPMQPVDGKKDRVHYITNPSYWMQPKIDGNKLIVFATRDQVWYQTRSLRLTTTPDIEFESELKRAANDAGPFILEGELTFLDCNDGEHRTGSQAATVNIELGQPTFPPTMKYVVFSAPFFSGEAIPTYGMMVEGGYRIATFIQIVGHGIVFPIHTAKTLEEKSMTASMQEAEGREGEVWFDPTMPYRPGKHKDESFVRTKYTEELEVMCTGFTNTTAEGHTFGAMEITDLQGRDLGRVGTGFSFADKEKLVNIFGQIGPFKVKILCQGRTEAGIPWHARFLEIVE